MYQQQKKTKHVTWWSWSQLAVQSNWFLEASSSVRNPAANSLQIQQKKVIAVCMVFLLSTACIAAYVSTFYYFNDVCDILFCANSAITIFAYGTPALICSQIRRKHCSHGYCRGWLLHLELSLRTTNVWSGKWFIKGLLMVSTVGPLFSFFTFPPSFVVLSPPFKLPHRMLRKISPSI